MVTLKDLRILTPVALLKMSGCFGTFFNFSHSDFLIAQLLRYAVGAARACMSAGTTNGVIDVPPKLQPKHGTENAAKVAGNT